MKRSVPITLATVVAAASATLFAAAFPDAILAGDAEPYRSRMAELFSGQWPYLDFPFEHLPGSLIPMVLAWLLGGYLSLQRYAIALAAVSTLLLVATSFLLRRLEPTIGEGLTIRWLILTIPLMPFLLFRNDSWTVFLVVAAFATAVSGRKAAASSLIGAGIASKFWPVAWVLIEWWRGRRKVALGLLILGILALVLLRSDPVLLVQRPAGIHTETLAGSIFGLVRSFSGGPIEVVITSAAYIKVPWWAPLLNGVAGLWLGVLSLRGLKRSFHWRRAWLLVGSTTGAIMVASPLLSTQYLAWLAPFSAAATRSWYQALGVNVISLVLVTTWDQAFSGKQWWWVTLVARNVLLLGQIAVLVRSVGSRSENLELLGPTGPTRAF